MSLTQVIEQGAGGVGGGGGGGGNVDGPAVSTNIAIARWNGVSGTLLSNSGVLIDNSNNVTGVVDFTSTGNMMVGGTGYFEGNLTGDSDILAPNGNVESPNLGIFGNVNTPTLALTAAYNGFANWYWNVSAADTLSFGPANPANGSLEYYNLDIKRINASTTKFTYFTDGGLAMTPGQNHSAFNIGPTFAAGDFNFQGLLLNVTQKGSNNTFLIGQDILLTQSGAGTLASAEALIISTPSITGSITNNYGIAINDQSPANVSGNGYGMIVYPQTGAAGVSRAISLLGTGVPNSIQLGASANIYSNAANNIRFSDATNSGGLDFNLTSTSTTINTVTQGLSQIILQNQTFTPGSNFAPISISPTFASENFAHIGVNISPTQVGANSNFFAAINISLTKTIGATVLSEMAGISIQTPIVTGTASNSEAILINNQTNANVTNPIGIKFGSSGPANCISFAGPIQYNSSGGNNIRFADSTNVGGLDFNLTTTTAVINTVTQNAASIVFQNNTYTPAQTFSSVIMNSGHSAENQIFNQLLISPTQFGANNQNIAGVAFQMNKSSGGTTLTIMDGAKFLTPIITGAVTNSHAIRILDQTNANATVSRAINITTAGVANSIALGGGGLLYGGGANLVQLMDTSNARGIAFSLTAASNQVISSVGNNGLIIGASPDKLGFFGTSPAIQQTSGTAITNNVVASGTTGQLDDFTDLVVYATDAQAIHNDIYQLGLKLKKIDDAGKLMGLWS